MKIRRRMDVPGTGGRMPMAVHPVRAGFFNPGIIVHALTAILQNGAGAAKSFATAWRMGLFRFGILLCAGLFFQQDALATDQIELWGDIIQVVLPSIAYGETFYVNDVKGRHEFYQSFYTTVLITHGLKNTVHERRPNGSTKSFPSGHTSAAFQGAAFMHARYGLAQAIPAYVAATFVGYSRIESRNHYPKDVLAGAAIGVFSSFYFIEPVKGLVLTPSASSHDYGLNLSLRW